LFLLAVCHPASRSDVSDQLIDLNISLLLIGLYGISNVTSKIRRAIQIYLAAEGWLYGNEYDKYVTLEISWSIKILSAVHWLYEIGGVMS
jgi:hypothetical protein